MADEHFENLLGICIPTYNRGFYLKQCLASIIKQFSTFDFPVYVSDNASSDDTDDVILYYKAIYDNIHYNRNSSNLGPYQNILNVIKMAQTDYVWLMGDDDAIMENSLNKIVKCLQNGYDFVILNSVSYDQNFERVKANKIIDCSCDFQYGPGEHEILLMALRKWGYNGYMSAMIIRRSLLLNLIKFYESENFILHNGSWLPTALFWEAIIGKSGLFLCEPIVLNRDNPRASGKNFWEYIFVDRVKTLEYLHTKGYNLNVLRRSLGFGILSTILLAMRARGENQNAVIFNDFVKFNKLISIRIKLIVMVIDLLPPLICIILNGVVHKILV